MYVSSCSEARDGKQQCLLRVRNEDKMCLLPRDSIPRDLQVLRRCCRPPWLWIRSTRCSVAGSAWIPLLSRMGPSKRFIPATGCDVDHEKSLSRACMSHYQCLKMWFYCKSLSHTDTHSTAQSHYVHSEQMGLCLPYSACKGETGEIKL